MELIIIFVIAYFIIKVVTKGDSSPSSSNSTISKADTGEYISLDEYDKIPRNNLADKKFVSEQLVGTIKSFDNSQKTGIIVSNNYTYEIIFQRNFNYDSFPNHMPKVNDIVVFQPQAINEKLFASNIEYYQSDMIINNTSSSTASTTNTSSTLLEEARNKQKLKCPMLSEPTMNTPYYALLKKYRSKYKEQVFQRKYLSEIQALIGFQRELSEIKSDLKHVRNGIGITANPTVRAIQNEEKSKTQPVQEQSQTINTTPPQSIKRSNPYRILICDNAAFMRMMLKDILTKNGYEVIAEAGDGLEAIERYYEFKPDLVFMDITMPKMDGIDATTTIKKMDSSANIVICSAMGQGEEEKLVMEAIRSGARDFIVKPFKPERILKTMAEIEPRLNDLDPYRTIKRIEPIYRDGTANVTPEQTATPPMETEQSQTVSIIPLEETGQSQAASQTPPVQEQRVMKTYPFDIRYSPELCFLTNTSLSDKFPENVGRGEMVIRYPFSDMGMGEDMDIKIAEYAIIVDDCLLQFSGDGKMYVLNIPDNAVSSYEITEDNAPQDMLKWVRDSVLRSQKQINVLYKTPNALQWLKLYTTILCYHTTHTVSKEDYIAAMRQLRQGFRFAPDDETIRIDNRQWYYGNERKTWGNIALNIFRDYFKEFTTYHN